MKILITNTQGRSGTTLLQTVISKFYGIPNLGEFIEYQNFTKYNKSIEHLAVLDNWCCKMFFDIGLNEFYNPADIIEKTRHDFIVNSYRKDLFDQYLSFQVGLHNKKWNADKKLDYQNFIISDPEQSINEFFQNINNYQDQLEYIRKKVPVIDVSYEDLIANNLHVNEKIDINQILKQVDQAPVKQNTKQEKINLIDNIQEVLNYWRIINDRT